MTCLLFGIFSNNYSVLPLSTRQELLAIPKLSCWVMITWPGKRIVYCTLIDSLFFIYTYQILLLVFIGSFTLEWWDAVLQKRSAWALFVLLLSTLVCCQPFFLFINFPILLPPPPPIQLTFKDWCHSCAWPCLSSVLRSDLYFPSPFAHRRSNGRPLRPHVYWLHCRLWPGLMTSDSICYVFICCWEGFTSVEIDR